MSISRFLLEFFAMIHYTSGMTDSLKTLIDIIPDHPALRIMHFVDTATPLVDKLAARQRDRDYEYQIQCLDPAQAEALQARFAGSPAITVRFLSLDHPRYHLQAKLYDFVFVEANVTEQGHFLKTLYAAMKNAADLFILLPISHQEEITQWRAILEKNFYVAVSVFDLNETVQIISAKKMHGWGA